MWARALLGFPVVTQVVSGLDVPMIRVCVIQDLYHNAEQLVQADPEKYACRNIQVAVLLRRTKQRRSLDSARF